MKQRLIALLLAVITALLVTTGAAHAGINDLPVEPPPLPSTDAL